MEYLPQQYKHTNRAPGYALVILLHVGLIYALVNGLQVASRHIIQDIGPVDVLPPSTPAPEPIKTIDMDKPTIDFRIPGIEFPENPPLKPTVAPIGNRGAIDKPAEPSHIDKPGGPDHQPAIEHGPIAPSVGTTCSNFASIRDSLATRFPVIADQANFEDQGIARFDMTEEVQLGANGEVLSYKLLQTSNPYAAQAMRSVVERGIRNLSCKGSGHAVKLEVPFGFELTN